MIGFPCEFPCIVFRISVLRCLNMLYLVTKGDLLVPSSILCLSVQSRICSPIMELHDPYSANVLVLLFPLV